jgi:hypothetical protein
VTARVDEIAPGVHRICVYVPEFQQRTLLCSDLFHHAGDGERALLGLDGVLREVFGG